VAASLAPRPSTHPRGLEGQLGRRRAEVSLRDLSIRPLREGGLTLRTCSKLIGVARSTLCDWMQRSSGEPIALGRRPRLATPKERREVLKCIWRVGPHVGTPTLERRFPDLPRAELAALKRVFVQDLARRRKRAVARLGWSRPGAVWAMDFTQLRARLDGLYEQVLVVRDLASGLVLCAEPMIAQDSRAVAKVLRKLFAKHGAPLVLKSDNGSPLIADAVHQELALRGVVTLRSPVRRPQYNGACEAGMRVLKEHLDFQAERLGAWSSAALEEARTAANDVVRRRSGRTAKEAWTTREPIPESLRESFHAALADGYVREWTDRAEPAILSKRDQQSVDRKVIGRALVELALLSIRRGPIL